MTRILEAKNITKKFLRPVPLVIFHEITLTLDAGQSLAIVGKSGEGKSTLLHILETIDTPTSGELYIFEKTASEQNIEAIRNRHFGFIFQAFHLLRDATALDNVLLPLRIAREKIGPHTEGYALAQALLEEVGLKNRMHHHVEKLSGGEKQRVAIARALINNPDVIFADEPTGNLDHITAEEVMHLLFSLVKKANKALVLVTHSTELAQQCDTVVRLENGTISQIYTS